MIFVTTLILTM